MSGRGFRNGCGQRSQQWLEREAGSIGWWIMDVCTTKGREGEVDGAWPQEACTTWHLAASDLFPTRLSIAYHRPAPPAYILSPPPQTFVSGPLHLLLSLPRLSIPSIHEDMPSLPSGPCLNGTFREDFPALSYLPSALPLPIPCFSFPRSICHQLTQSIVYLFFVIAYLSLPKCESRELCSRCSLLLRHCGAHGSLSLSIWGLDECCSLWSWN